MRPHTHTHTHTHTMKSPDCKSSTLICASAGSSIVWTVYSFFASQTLHNRIFFKKKSGDVNDEANFSLFILLHNTCTCVHADSVASA